MYPCLTHSIRNIKTPLKYQHEWHNCDCATFSPRKTRQVRKETIIYCYSQYNDILVNYHQHCTELPSAN